MGVQKRRRLQGEHFSLQETVLHIRLVTVLHCYIVGYVADHLVASEQLAILALVVLHLASQHIRWDSAAGIWGAVDVIVL